MLSSRATIAMDGERLVAYARSMRTVTCATNGPRGLPHLAPLWFTITEADKNGIQFSAWTFGKSQTVLNLRKDPRAVLQLEDGDSYGRLRGAVLECDVAIVDDEQRVRDAGLAIACRYGADDVAAPKRVEELSPRAREEVERQVTKRVALQFSVRRQASGDHRELPPADRRST